MKQKEKSLLARKKILEAAGVLFTKKGFDNTTLQDIMDESGLSKGAIYHYFKSKEDIIEALNSALLLENNPFDAVKKRNDLSGLQKMQLAMKRNHTDKERMQMTKQALPILKNPRILAGMIDSNRRLLTPIWLELIEEGKKDGSIQTQFARELSELIPLLDFWMTPSIYPATGEQMYNKLLFISEMLSHMGLPLIDNEIMELFQRTFSEIGETV